MVSVEFKNAVVEAIRKIVDEDVVVDTHETQKNNGLEKTSVTLRKQECSVAPTVYLEKFEQEYNDGKSIEMIAREIVKIAKENEAPDYGNIADRFLRFENVKDLIVYDMVNKEKNKKLLENVEHVDVLGDLALVFKVQLDKGENGIGTITIRNEHSKTWGVSTEEIFEAAKENTPKIRPVLVKTMADTLAELTGMPAEMFEAEGNMHVISNVDRINGAAVIMYKDVLKELADKLESDLMILPSSIHECLALPAKTITENQANDMICQVNETELAAEDYLSNHAYFFSREKAEFEF